MKKLSVDELSGIWAGQLELLLKPTTVEYGRGFRGAYTTVLARCRGVEEYLDLVVQPLDQEGFVIGGIERLFPLASGAVELTESLAELAARTHHHPVQWTSFHLFKGDG